MKDAVDLLNDKIAELEAERTMLRDGCSQTVQQMQDIIELLQKRGEELDAQVKELEIDLAATFKEMADRGIENTRLATEVANLKEGLKVSSLDEAIKTIVYLVKQVTAKDEEIERLKP